MASPSVASVERRTIDFVPVAERHGNVRSLFTLWFGANMTITCIAAGAICATLGLPLPWTLLAVVLGHLVGAVFMALHSAQGPLLGIPQMIQSRAQFGYFGAVLPLVLVLLMYLGYFASSAVLTGQAITGWLGLDVNLSIVLGSVVTAVLAIYGYRLLHATEKWLSLVSGLGFLFLSVQLVRHVGLGRWTAQGFSWGPFLLAAAIAATWQLTYAPYVADYSRYLPVDTPVAQSFWFTYGGTVIASTWMFAFGAVAANAAADAFAEGSVSFVVNQAGGATWIFFLVIVAGNIAVNALNLYGMFMSATTTFTVLGSEKVGPALRTAGILVLAALGTVIAIVGRTNFVDNFTNFILLLAYFLIPWTSINLVDFYLVRKERYVIAEIFDPKGRYGGVDWRAMVAYLVGIVLELPFVNSTFYVGPFVEPLGGADVSWILGIFIAGGLYLVLMKRFPVRLGHVAVHGDAPVGQEVR
ncbi:purine-cytosine permease family protein [Kineococcus rhizosphaerae]|uniref:NCS1 family nucleobase:cation symporter-1 n=1 Tax=Kineococcus rhizosphaerae TaxID=559628 RepID=A0A2T0QYS4_9ACTN|nr:cytosine permease [Kineococcus rhizosphaerae]PRY11532.1 NCS1 family nucleobase:cation symporter-1 [Kineococcus rhizosphaerae]